MAISAVSGFGSNNEYQSWVDQAYADKKKLEDHLGIDTSEGSETNKTSGSTSSTSDKKDTSSTTSLVLPVPPHSC